MGLFSWEKMREDRRFLIFLYFEELGEKMDKVVNKVEQTGYSSNTVSNYLELDFDCNIILVWGLLLIF